MLVALTLAALQVTLVGGPASIDVELAQCVVDADTAYVSIRMSADFGDGAPTPSMSDHWFFDGVVRDCRNGRELLRDRFLAQGHLQPDSEPEVLTLVLPDSIECVRIEGGLRRQDKSFFGDPYRVETVDVTLNERQQVLTRQAVEQLILENTPSAEIKGWSITLSPFRSPPTWQCRNRWGYTVIFDAVTGAKLREREPNGRTRSWLDLPGDSGTKPLPRNGEGR